MALPLPLYMEHGEAFARNAKNIVKTRQRFISLPAPNTLILPHKKISFKNILNTP